MWLDVSRIALLCLVACRPSSPETTSVDDRSLVLDRIAFGSCCDQRIEQPIWNAVFAQRPDLFLFTGDNVYADADSEEALLATYDQASKRPGFMRLLRDFRVLATYDDHDFGRDDSGRENPIRSAAARACLDSFAVPADDPRRARAGVYGAYRFGPDGQCVQVILLDTRYFRDRLLMGENTRGKGYGRYLPNDDPAATLLGAEQWVWLEAALSQPADLRLIVSSVQVLADEHQREGWGNFPRERKRLFDLIRATRAEGVIFLSGDVHYAELSVDESFAYPLYDFTSSPLAHEHGTDDGAPTPYSSVTNRYRVPGASYTAVNHGRIDIEWAGEDTRITLSLRRVDGTAVHSRVLRLGDLRF